MVPYKVELEEGKLDPGRRGHGRWLGEPQDHEKTLADIIDEKCEIVDPWVLRRVSMEVTGVHRKRLWRRKF